MLRLTLRPLVSTRLDRCLLEELNRELAPELSRARLKLLFERKLVRVGGGVAEPSLQVSTDQVYEIGLELDASELLPDTARPSKQGSFLPVVYEDADVLVLNKQAGIPSVPFSSSETETAVGSALAHDPGLTALATTGHGRLEPGLLHRLDTGTSGLLVFARTPSAFSSLQQAWRERRVTKIYRALAGPIPRLPYGKVQTERLKLGHDAKSSKRMRVVNSASKNPFKDIRGKPLETVTHLTLLAPGDFEIQIETGVMHQIRCTLAHLGSPILGDAIYGGKPSSRLWLHAWKLKLPLPSGQEISLEAPLPSGWRVP